MRTTITRILNVTDEQRCVDTLTKAFAADPAVRWMYPGAEQYGECFPQFVRAFAGNAFARGTADCDAEVNAVALWLEPEVQPDEAVVVSVLERSVARELLADVFSVLEQMGTFHPAAPHWYLPLVGVEPAFQGRGCGSALLRERLAQCDSERVAAYLESTNPRNVPLYERLGFEIIGRIQAGKSPTIIPMMRQPC